MVGHSAVNVALSGIISSCDIALHNIVSMSPLQFLGYVAQLVESNAV